MLSNNIVNKRKLVVKCFIKHIHLNVYWFWFVALRSLMLFNTANYTGTCNLKWIPHHFEHLATIRYYHHLILQSNPGFVNKRSCHSNTKPSEYIFIRAFQRHIFNCKNIFNLEIHYATVIYTTCMDTRSKLQKINLYKNFLASRGKC